MAYQDFREFLEALRKSGELIEVDRAVSPELEVAKAMRKSAAMSGPAIIFKNNGTAFPVVGGVYNTRSKALIAFQTTEKEAFERVLHGMATRIPPVVVADGPVHENVITGDAVDISRVPVCKYSPDDGGPYITAGIVVSKDPETGVPDIGHYRFEVIDKQTMSFLALPNHRFGRHLAKARRMGHKTYHAALVIGVDPVMAYTCPVQVPDGTNDFEVVGGMRGAALELVHCKTIDVDVPARAELVFELEVDMTKEAFEGPLGEFTGYYTPGSKKPIARIKAITHRNGAYYQALLTGVPPTENHILKQMPYEASYFAMLKAQHPTLTNLAIPASGGVAFYVVMSMKQRYAGEARHAILTTIASSQRPKKVVVVDPDIDVRDPDQVEWAITFRTQPARDIIIIDGLPGGTLDPSIDGSLPLNRRVGSAMGIDATFPFGEDEQKAADVPAGEVCGPAVAEQGHEFFKVADVPGWQDYDFPELRK
ncbi:MAG TPA: UbiD family decarboxylase [Acetobacteraceae bacterium]|jgi:UbiD family decarboxylase|nr:UbiD family decarboxylase [Acetobacteraceae bacterium]